ncbi:ABC transporter ATP-binding protein [Alteribacter natronophilus]|uniref:ABC transporter ATP-binding protein n=1 Tax=Alteribacter natronophilus TaxID=2583810 RepID=UPI00110F4A56|nr:ABC transporter ATP-binding protein [Alteribacter natronophilus]TMW71448.1 ABC transporter ATP-binding protein [Alteribacter natronophilus]
MKDTKITDSNRKNTPTRRLIRYALDFKKTIIFALVLLAIAAAAELTGPFIAKHMIDNHILGIEREWVEVDDAAAAEVVYDDRAFIRGDRFEGEAEQIGEAQLLQVGITFIFLEDPITFDGARELDGSTLTVTRGDESAVYDAVPLTADETFTFYGPEVKYLVMLMGGYFLLVAFGAFLHYHQSFLLQRSANEIIQKMRNDVFGKVQQLPVKYFDKHPAGKILSRVTNDTEAIRELYVRVLATFFTSVIYLIGIYIALFILEPRLATAALVLLPILVVWAMLYRKFAAKYNHVIRERLSEINGKINENIQGMPVIQAFGREKEVNREFEEVNSEHYKYNNKLLSLNAMTSFNLVNLFRNIAFVGLIWYFGGASVGVGAVFSLGVLYAFVDYLNRLFEPVNNLVNQLAQLEEARVAGERVFQLMDEDGVQVEAGSVPRFRGDVKFDSVSFAYTDEDYVLKNISFEANQGETVAFVGHTGSGKSSIMNVLFRFYDHQKGTVTIDGTDIQSLSKQAVREHMAIVLQDPFLFTGTIASNVGLDDPRISREQIREALEKVGAGEMIDALPGGIDEEVKEKGSTLSAGQRQLISFARALVFDPPILILDEATANIDTETEAVIQQALDVVKDGRTTFVIAHRLSTIRAADQIIVLNQGEILERGDHDELMTLEGTYYYMYQLQQGIQKEQESPAG